MYIQGCYVHHLGVKCISTSPLRTNNQTLNYTNSKNLNTSEIFPGGYLYIQILLLSLKLVIQKAIFIQFVGWHPRQMDIEFSHLFKCQKEIHGHTNISLLE